MSNTVITNYTDLNGPSTKADSSVVVIVNKDGSLSVDQNLLGTLMGSDGSQGAGISVVRVGHEGKPDDATDSESGDETIPHVTLSVDSYYDEPNSIIKYDSGAEMLQSLRIETRENSLIGFQNDHCYTSLTSPGPGAPQRSNSFTGFDEPILEITHTPPPKPVPQSKKITILEQQIIPRGRKLVLNPSESPVLLKNHEALSKPLPIQHKSKDHSDLEKSSENTESSSISSGESIPDRDSDSDYRDDRNLSLRSMRKSKLKPRILKAQPTKAGKLDPKVVSRVKSVKNVVKKELKEKIKHKNVLPKKPTETDLAALNAPSSEVQTPELVKAGLKQTPKSVKREKKTPAHVTALLSDMTSLFSTPDVIRRVSTDAKTPGKQEKETPHRKGMSLLKPQEMGDSKVPDNKNVKAYMKLKERGSPSDKVAKGYDPIPQLDDASLAQILQDTTGMSSAIPKVQQIAASNTMSSPGMGPLSPTLDLLGGLQPEEEGLTEDLLMHVAQLVESSENLQEVIDKQVLGKVDAVGAKTQSPFQQGQAGNVLGQTSAKSLKTLIPQKSPIEIVRRDGRVITLPPIEAPATRSSKRKTQTDTSGNADVIAAQLESLQQQSPSTPEPQVQQVLKQQISKKIPMKKPEPELPIQAPVADKTSAEVSQESWNSEDDPYRLWCICKQPHNNRFMICCDSCEDWFHGKCVNITKAMGQQMEEQGIEWRCPSCIKKGKPGQKSAKQMPTSSHRKSDSYEQGPSVSKETAKSSCIVCKRPARASSIYCSDACILKHAQDSLGNQASPTKEIDPGSGQEKLKTDSRVIVYERKSGRLLAGPNAPTAENLKLWLQRNPTFEVVRPGTLHTIKPNLIKKRPSSQSKEPKKIQTTLNFERVPRKSAEQNPYIKTAQSESREKILARIHQSPKDETRQPPQPKTPVLQRSLPALYQDIQRPSTSTAKPVVSEPKKPAKAANRSQTFDKAPSVTPSTSRKKDPSDGKKKMESTEPIRENVRKALQEQMTIRMNENTGSKFTKDEIKQFAIDTEFELHELFKDVGMKYKVKYRSLIFNIKDRKNLSLWKKICDRTLSPKQLVRLSPEELASQELAQWRDKESKHQLELIKKSELDLLAASKTYVLKTHKGEEVMDAKESVSTELDPNVPVEDVVTVLNETVNEETPTDTSKAETPTKPDRSHSKSSSRKRGKEDSTHSKKSSRASKRDSERKSRRQSEAKEKEERSTRRSDRKSRRDSSPPKEKEKQKSDSKEKDSGRSRHRSRSPREKSKRGKSREHSRSASKGRERQSPSRDDTKRRRSTRNKQSSSTEEKPKTRARSQENTKSKNDSTDSDSIERPKSAMLKDAHPEYDPHEPMITSAFSEEDLRKSGGDNYEEMGEYSVADYDDPTKDFTIDTSIVLPPLKFPVKHDKSETESDQEPTSTVDNAALTVWNGCINMVDVARFYVAAHEASGSATEIEEDLLTELDIVGRINPETVWEYIGKMRRANNKDIILLRLQAANDEEKMQYIALYSYLSSRNRLGVVKVSNTTTVKDIYIVPLSANTSLPSVLLPLDGPGLGENKTHLLLAIIIRQRKKRSGPPLIPEGISPPKITRSTRKRSYTPPIAGPKTPIAVTKAPVVPKVPIAGAKTLPLPATYTSPALSTTVKDQIAASLAASADDEPYSPGSSSSGGSAPVSSVAPAGTVLRSKMEELNRQIEEQKQQILKMAQADSSVEGDDEAYSPSRPMTPPAPSDPLADIALPSNLQEILATIKQRETDAGNDAT